MERQWVRYHLEQSVARVTLNRPRVLNSFHRGMAHQLQSVLAEIQKEERARSILLTGEGRAFCAGQDLAEAVGGEGSPQADIAAIVRDSYNPIIQAIRTTEKPFLCAVNGVAAGAGANIALACDIVLASREASFLQAFSKIGLIPDSGGTFFLPRLVGLSRATAMMMLAEPISADEACEMGLIYRVCEPEKLLPEALELAQELAHRPTRALGLIKRALNQSLVNDLPAQLAVEEQLQAMAARTRDFREGVAAFLAKRKPDFQGR
ncbi:MAG: enoyl-CoA hydratase-related protein [Acidobacteriota bacterium]